MKKIRTILVGTSLAFVPLQVIAQEAPQGFSLGLVGMTETGIYVGEGSSTSALPLLRYDTDAFSVGLPDGLRVTAYQSGAFRFSGVISPRFSDIDDSDAVELAGLDRTTTVDGGFLMEYELFEDTELSFTALTELGSEHGGSELTLELERGIFSLGIPVFLTGGLNWQSSDLASYLYGVSAGEATGARPAYDPGSVLTPFVGVRVAVPFSESVRLIGNVEAEFLPSAISDSPIIEEDLGLSAFFGVAYSF